MGTQGCGMGVLSASSDMLSLAARAFATSGFAWALCFTVLAFALGVLSLRHGAALNPPPVLYACECREHYICWTVCDITVPMFWQAWQLTSLRLQPMRPLTRC